MTPFTKQVIFTCSKANIGVFVCVHTLWIEIYAYVYKIEKYLMNNLEVKAKCCPKSLGSWGLR